MIYEALIQVFLVLLEHPEKATVYFVLAVISGFLISSTWYPYSLLRGRPKLMSQPRGGGQYI